MDSTRFTNTFDSTAAEQAAIKTLAEANEADVALLRAQRKVVEQQQAAAEQASHSPDGSVTVLVSNLAPGVSGLDLKHLFSHADDKTPLELLSTEVHDGATPQVCQQGE